MQPEDKKLEKAVERYFDHLDRVDKSEQRNTLFMAIGLALFLAALVAAFLFL